MVLHSPMDLSMSRSNIKVTYKKKKKKGCYEALLFHYKHLVVGLSSGRALQNLGLVLIKTRTYLNN